jgi:hypothetical protein
MVRVDLNLETSSATPAEAWWIEFATGMIFSGRTAAVLAETTSKRSGDVIGR